MSYPPSRRVLLLPLLCLGTLLAAQRPFITTWKTDNPGTSSPTSITIPTGGGYFNYDVDWDNDGVYDDLGVSGTVTHDYGVAGTYTVAIRGTFPWLRFSEGGDKQKILDVAQWGDIEWASLREAFASCTNLDVSATDAPDLSRVTNMANAFYNCSSLTADLNHWDVSNVTQMDGLFALAAQFNSPLDNWDVRRVKQFNRMFIRTPFNQDISGWQPDSAYNMERMFSEAADFNQPIGGWKLPHVVSTQSMFLGAKAFNQDLTDWGMESNTNMADMFRGAESFNGEIGNWNTGRVTDMEGMFAGATAFNRDISGWNTERVTTMELMFSKAAAFNQPIGKWNTGAVKDMHAMFREAAAFNQPLADWDVGQVTRMSQLFFKSAFDQPVGDWNTASVETMSALFAYTPFNRDIGGWNTGSVRDMSMLFLYATEFNQDIGDWDTREVTRMSAMFDHALAFNQDLSRWQTGKVEYMDAMFQGAAAFNYPLEGWDVSRVKTMQRMFYSAFSFNLPLNGWNTASLTNTIDMFRYARIFNQPVDNWDVSQVTSMVGMFYHADAFDQALAPWDVSSVENMYHMFLGCGLSTDHYDDALIAWSQLDLRRDVPFNAGTSRYCRGAEARAYLIDDLGWEIQDRGPVRTPPVAICRDLTVTLDSEGRATLTADQLDGGSTDDCRPEELTFSASQTEFTCADLGTVAVTLTVTDNTGNTATCTANVTVVDGPLTLSDCPADVVVKASEGNCEAGVSWDPPRTVCTATLTSNYAPGDRFPLGVTTVSYTATDAAGNTLNCSFTVTVSSDLAAAVAGTVPATCQTGSRDGAATLTVTGGLAPYAFDWDDDGTFAEGATATGLGAGDHLVTIRDAAGCEVSRMVAIDAEAPMVTFCPADITVDANALHCSAVVTWEAPRANCPGLSLTATHASGDTFPTGITEVTYAFTDAAGRSDTCRFSVTVTSDLGVERTVYAMPSCHDATDGSLAVAGTGGRPPYRYAWTAGGTEGWVTAPVRQGLAAGTYPVRVTDSLGCAGTGVAALPAPAPLSFAFRAQDDGTGGKIVDLDISGGTAPYAEAWSGRGILGDTTATVIRVTANGTIAATAYDAHGCTAVGTLTLDDLPDVCGDLDFSVFPNPSNGAFTLAFRTCAYEMPVRVYDAVGRLVVMLHNRDLRTEVDLTGLPRGTYFLRAGTGKGEVVRGLVVQ